MSEPDESSDRSRVNHKSFELPSLDPKEFVKILNMVINDPNLGAGIDVSGSSGSGKSCFSVLLAVECLKSGIPIMMIDPHGDTANSLMRQIQALGSRIKSRIRYIRLSDLNSIAAINPLAKFTSTVGGAYFDRCQQEIQVAMVADCILAACGEASVGFTSRPVLEKWIKRWLTILIQSGLTLPCATMLLDPNHPVYREILKLVADDLSRFQMESLSKLRSFDQESEIGSARNRLLALLRHPTVIAMLSRVDNVLDFQEVYDNDQSLVIDASCGELLPSNAQSLIANIYLSMYLQVVFRTPEKLRRRRFLIIDELPIFAQSCGPLLERCATEIRKYKTSMALLHQGANRFPNRTEDAFLATILDMCKCKVFFRHSFDAEFFGKLVSRAAGAKLTEKRAQINRQQYQDGNSIIELVDRNEVTSDSTAVGQTSSIHDGVDESDSITSCLKDAAESARSSSRSRSASHGSDSGTSSSETHSVARGVTYKSTVIPNVVSEFVCTGVQYYTNEEIDRGAFDLIANLDTGEAIFFADGRIKPVQVQVPLLPDPFSHAPKFGRKKVQELIDSIYQLPYYAAPQALLDDHDEFTQRLLAYLAQQPARYQLDRNSKTLLVEGISVNNQNRPEDLGL